MSVKVLSHPNSGNTILEKSRELLGSPEIGLSAAKPLKEDFDYLIFDNGLLYSLKMKRFLTGKIDNSGYKVYRLAIYNELTSKKGKMLYAHRLVAEYFLENDNPKNKIYVHHKDGNKLNNNYTNLEWVTPSKNSQEFLTTHQKQVSKVKYYLNNLPNEEWKIVLYNPSYSVSNKGRIINNKTNRLLKIDDSQKYLRVSFNDRKHYFIHRLVYCTFNNDYNLNGYVISHIDRDVTNNDITNLEKITISGINKRRN